MYKTNNSASNTLYGGHRSGSRYYYVGANRWQLGAGMFLTPMLMAKIEYVKQEFTGYPVHYVRHGGKFNGLMFEEVVGFLT